MLYQRVWLGNDPLCTSFLVAFIFSSTYIHSTKYMPKKVRDSPPKVTFNGPSESTIATLIETDDFGDLESWHHRQISLK